jgi:NAD-dependent DNA ligase
LPLSGKTIVVTGTLKNYSREEIQEAITKRRTCKRQREQEDRFLLAGEEAGSKLRRHSSSACRSSPRRFERLIAES